MISPALGALRIGGACVLIGAVFPGPEAAIAPEQIVRRHLSIHGVHNYAPCDLIAAFEFLNRATIYPFADLVQAWYPLSAIEEAFRAAETGAFRVGVRPDL